MSRGADLSQGWGRSLGDLRVSAVWWSGEAAGVGVGARTPIPTVLQKDRVLEGWVPLRASPTAQGLHPVTLHQKTPRMQKFSLPDHVLISSSSASKHLEGKAFVPILQMQLVRLGQEQRVQNCPHLLPPPTTGLPPPASPDLGPPERVRNL